MERPARIARLLDVLGSVESRQDRIELLIGIADRFRPLPSEVAERPYDKNHLIPHCESEVYFWPVELPDGRLKLHFAVENPQGLSARAMAVILDESLSGEPLEDLVRLEDDLPMAIFGNELSMGKSMGLTSMVAMVRLAARARLQQREA